MPRILHTRVTKASVERLDLDEMIRDTDLLRWPRLFEQRIRVAKWSVCRG